MAYKKYVFKKNQKFVMWKYYNQECYWCHEPIKYGEVTIDHVIPECYIEKPAELSELKRVLGLDDNFVINDYCNWLPCHDKCNKSKAVKVFDPIPVYLDIFKKTLTATPVLRKRVEEYNREQRVDEALAMIEVAYSKNEIGIEDFDRLKSLSSGSVILTTIFEVADRAVQKSEWKLIEKNGLTQVVSNGAVVGVMPTDDNDDISWMCPTCGSRGPWNGVICLICGQRSAPD